MNIEQVARVCHETNRAYRQTIGDESQKPWHDAEEWQRKSAIQGVEFLLANPEAPVSALHDAWCYAKISDGWKYGPTKDASLLTHPCLVPHAELPVEQRTKAYLFKAVVSAFTAIALHEYQNVPVGGPSL